MNINVFEFDFVIPVVTSKPAEKLATRRLKESSKYRNANPDTKRKKYLSPIYIDELGNHVSQETPGRILYTNNLVYLNRMDQSFLLRELMKINEINKSKK
jgi:hypothetical protein